MRLLQREKKPFKVNLHLSDFISSRERKNSPAITGNVKQTDSLQVFIQQVAEFLATTFVSRGNILISLCGLRIIYV